ncbi:hypothetical protein B0H17DRAFT_1099256 [Mycena rosella]|uniref:Uncharacterized protein n=1 Tax=Mycena rosella TaxID=1033263 RepID=A0AAD7CNQ5_MYCRO|nr:hypothetical protein B0H17DRAFT_1099256 [Mycena rosella]
MHSLILRHASRLQSLELFTHRDCFFELADIRPFPLLRDLMLGSFGGMLQSSGAPIPVFSGAPLLRHLSLEDMAPSALLMPWSQLTKFTGVLVSLQECLGVLRLTPSLCEFIRCNSPEDEEILIQDPPMHHSNINSLTIQASDEVDHDILEFLTLPRLQNFRLGDRFGRWTEELDDIILRFLSRTSATLRTFAIGLSPWMA